MALSTSASSKTIIGDLPPSSIVTCLSWPAAAPATLRPCRHGAGQRHLGDIRMVDQQRAGSRSPCTTLNRPLGRPASINDFGDLQRAERGDFIRLEDEGIAGDQRGRGLPAGDLLRIVPRADASTMPSGIRFV